MSIAEATQTPSDNAGQIHTSALLQKLIREAPPDTFTMDWLMGHLPGHSFGIIILFLSLIAILPIISVIARILILILAVQIIMGYRCPVLPRRLMVRRLPSRYLVGLNRHVVPALKSIEQLIRPRWPILLKGTRRLSAFVIILLTILDLLAPVPMANVPPAVICALMALAYIEHDGLLLTIAFIPAVALLATISWVVL